jgi:tetratricopeptide (TPR) repeat protein
LSKRKKRSNQRPAPEPLKAAPETKRRSGWKLWRLRLLLMIGGPVIFFVLVELVLRLAGFGHPTSFLLPSVINGQKVYIENDRVGWRYFGPNFARRPVTFSIAREKPPESVRIFVFGESAAYGDPQPEFGLPRMLQAFLSLRFPGVRFEVVNAAMTGINSHSVLPIARDCARAGGDVWVLYMGNNEVVGPFGAGTVFGPQAPRLALIRGSLALKATRFGQLIDGLVQKLHPPPADKSEWGGMLMFLGHQVPFDDPRMDAVAHHFERNLSDILAAGRAKGAGIVVSTVAVNLKDCAPFASRHQPLLDEAAEANWRGLCQKGFASQTAGRHTEALEILRQAEALDGRVAELQFVMARSCFALGQTAEAQRRFSLARDLDTLRFRCDSRLNGITRRAATGRESDRILLADSEDAFAQQSPGLVPGAGYFYEHVHLTFEGNYLLARTIAEQLVKLLPENVRTRDPSRPWPTAEECGRRLAWSDWHRAAAVNQMLGRLADPPFTGQLNHVDDIYRLSLQLEQLRPRARAAVPATETLCREALALDPDDTFLAAQHVQFLQLTGDLKGAAETAQRLVERLPHSPETWMLLGGALAKQQKYDDAARAFQEAFRRDPQNFWALQNLAQAYAASGRPEDAMREYQHALRIKPRFGTAYLELGRLLEQAGKKEEAEKNYRLALQNRIYRTEELTTLAQLCQQRGWLEAAVTNYLDALKLSPGEPVLHLGAGHCLAGLGRNGEAQLHFAEAARLGSGSGEARFMLGLELGRQNKPAEAAEQFREAVRLMPELVEARLNLAIALKNQGNTAEALEQFWEVLRRSPTNTIALRNVELLQNSGK